MKKLDKGDTLLTVIGVVLGTALVVGILAQVFCGLKNGPWLC